MRDPEVFLAYAPRGPGLRCAVAYLKDGRDVYGWFTGLRADALLTSGYFLLEHFYANAPTRYEATEELHARWSLDEARRHELARMQEAFSREWLSYGDEAEREAYDEAELGTGEVRVRYARLASFSKLQPTWTHYSPGFERAVLNALAKRWPLDYSPERD
jgi:hypothetical protein